MKLGLSLGIAQQQASGGASPTPLEGLIASSATLAVYDWTDTASMTAGDGGAVVQGAGDTIATVPNAKTPGTMNLIGTGAARPIYNNGAVHDGTDDFLALSFTADTGPANATLIYVVKTSDNSFMLGGTNSTSFFAGGVTDGSALAAQSGMTPTYEANGAALVSPTRDGLHTAWATGAAVTATIIGADYEDAAISQIRNAWAGAGFFISGNCMLIAVLNGSDGDYANALALAEAEAARVITALGL